MLRRTLLGLCAAFAVTAAQAQTPAPVPATPAAPPAKPNPRVKIETPEGAVVLELFADKAPITVANYLKYVDRGLFNGATFYRASKPKDYKGNDYGLVQGGLQNDPKKVLPPIAHESTIKTGLTHKTQGTISMGRHAPGSAQAVEGLDVIQKIIVMPTDPNKGEGAMKGEMLVKPIRITKVSRVPVAPAPAPAATAPVTSATPAPPPATPSPKVP